VDSLKPIEEGCLAMIINTNNAENNGKIVAVLKFLGVYEVREGEFPIWKVDYSGPNNIDGMPSSEIRESRLLRIDDPDLTEESEESQLLTIED